MVPAGENICGLGNGPPLLPVPPQGPLLKITHILHPPDDFTDDI